MSRQGVTTVSEQDCDLERERRLRRAAVTAASHQPPDPAEPAEPVESQGDEGEDEPSPSQWFQQRGLWVDHQIRRSMERGEFDNLPGYGKPIPGLDGTHDPDWWVKKLVEREKLTGVLPPALQLRKEDAELEALLDRETTEQGVRRTVEEFNDRVVEARRQLLGGPPVITGTRDVEDEVAAWRSRRAERLERQRQQVGANVRDRESNGRRSRRFWWSRRRGARGSS